MKVSMRTVYGLRAMFDLAYHYSHNPVPVSDISRREAISVPYVEQVLFALRKRGLVTSVRGLRGGYQLAKRPEELTVGEVIRVFEDKGLARFRVPEPRRGERYHVVDQAVGRLVWTRLVEAMAQVWDHVTFKHLCDEVRRAVKQPTFEHPYVIHGD